MSRSTAGWGFVVAQGVLLVLLVVLPGRDDWPTPVAIQVLSVLIIFGGAALMFVSALRLGRSLTPTPVPVEDGELVTTGLYQYMRHPIYTGVLATVAGWTLRSGSLIHLVLAAATFVFFGFKARWEERRLAEHYRSYADYAATTPRFIPRPRS